MDTSAAPIAVRVLRRNWYLPAFGTLLAIGGVFLLRSDLGNAPVGAAGGLGLFGAWVGSVFAAATAWRNSYPLAVPASLVPTRSGFDLDDRSIDAENVTEAKLVPKRGRGGEVVAVLTLRDGETLPLWMKEYEAETLLLRLGVAVGDARATFRLSLRFRLRLAIGYLVAGLPLLVAMLVSSGGDWTGTIAWWWFMGTVVSFVAALLLGFARGRIRIGVDGFTRRWLGFERFTRFADVERVTSNRASLTSPVEIDTIVVLSSGKRIALRAPEEPDDDVDRGVEGRALFDHLVAAHERSRRRALDEVRLRAMLGRGDRSDDAWFAEIDGLLRGGAARYRVATIEPGQVADVVRDVASPPDVRIAAAAALVRFDAEYRPMVQRAADACAQAELQAGLAAVSEAEDEQAVKAALRRLR